MSTRAVLRAIFRRSLKCRAPAPYIAAKFTLDHTVQTDNAANNDQKTSFVGVLSRSKRSASIPPSMVFA